MGSRVSLLQLNHDLVRLDQAVRGLIASWQRTAPRVQRPVNESTSAGYSGLPLAQSALCNRVPD